MVSVIPHKFSISNFGPIVSADLTLGHLNVFVGPQATGKSLALQLIKLIGDTGTIHQTMSYYGADWKQDPDAFLDAYFGEGMHSLRSAATKIRADEEPAEFNGMAKKNKKRSAAQRIFFIPAQRVLAINPSSGWFRGYNDYRPGDPFAVKDFSEKLRRLAENEFSEEEPVFPQERRLKKTIRNALTESIFGNFDLRLETQLNQRRFVLKRKGGSSLPYTVWSAGQREFVPLLLGAYQLLPRTKTPRREDFELAIIEELEMGLHPAAISAAMLLILDLLQRGYRVCLSTHSPQVLDTIWAIDRLRRFGGANKDILDLFQIGAGAESTKLAEAALNPAISTKVYYFERASGIVRDISNLDPSSEQEYEAGWGGLTEFSGRAGEIVARTVALQSLDRG